MLKSLAPILERTRLNQLQLTHLEKIAFWILILFNLGYVFSVDTFGTMDGPTHLYNAGLLNSIKTDTFIQENYVSNGTVLPNFLTHFFLSFLFLFFKANVSEKIMLSCIFVLIPVTFRYCVKLYSEGKSNFSLFIFPIVSNNLLHLGFFNMNFAFIFFNIQLILIYILIKNSAKWYWILAFVINSLLLFYSHAFVYIISLALSAIICLVYTEFKWKFFLKKATLLLALSLPAFASFLYFYFTVPVTNYNYDISVADKVIRLIEFSPAIVYGLGELPYCIATLLLLIGLTAIILHTKSMPTFLKFKENKKDVFFISVVILLFSVFKFENGMATGMLMDRLLLSFFYLLILWVCCYKIESKWLFSIVLIVTVWGYVYGYDIKKPVLRELSTAAKRITKASKYIKPQTYVYGVNLEDNWIQSHYSEYIGVKKSVVILNNYEASLPWFTLRWRNWDKIQNMINSVNTYDSTSTNVLPNYILVYGNLSKLEKDEYTNIRNCIQQRTKKIYYSPDNRCAVYEVTKTN